MKEIVQWRQGCSGYSRKNEYKERNNGRKSFVTAILCII